MILPYAPETVEFANCILQTFKTQRCTASVFSIWQIIKSYSFHRPVIEDDLQRFYIFFVISRARQIDPVVHDTHARLVLLRYQVRGTGFIDRPLFLDLHTVGFVEAALDIGKDTA